MSNNHAIDICAPGLDEKDRMELWLVYYLAKWQCLPVRQMDEAMNESIHKVHETLLALANGIAPANCRISLKEFAVSVGLAEETDSLDTVKDIVKQAAQSGYNEAVAVAIRHAVAKGVVQSAVRGNAGAAAAAAAGRRGAIVALERSATLAGGQAASKAFTALGNPVVGFSATVGEIVATSLLSAWGIDNPTAVVAAGAGSGILCAAIAGGAVAGPVGAGAGVIIGAGSVAVGACVNGLFNAFQGGYDDNWCYIEVGELRRDTPTNTICAGTYKGNDGWYIKTYQNKYYSSNEMDYFSAGNEQSENFQVSFWDEWENNITTYTNVWYRDTFYVSRRGTQLVIVYARGGYNNEHPGKVDIRIHNGSRINLVL
uniref:Uncharacterized protein n=1 Tax=Heterosigma akashiwo TaxID=2829 RepID=A0A7S3XQK4_HETAK